MDAALFNQIADGYDAPVEEREHELANARWDLRHLPETVHDRDVFEIAADALTAARALPERPPLPEVHFAHHAWAPGHIVSNNWGRPTPADEFMQWCEKALVGQR